MIAEAAWGTGGAVTPGGKPLPRRGQVVSAECMVRSYPVTPLADPLCAALGPPVGLLAVDTSLAEAGSQRASWLDRRLTPNTHVRAVMAEASRLRRRISQGVMESGP